MVGCECAACVLLSPLQRKRWVAVECWFCRTICLECFFFGFLSSPVLNWLLFVIQYRSLVDDSGLLSILFNCPHPPSFHKYIGGLDSDSEMVRAVCGGGWGQALMRAVMSREVSTLMRALFVPDPPAQTALVAYMPTPTPSVRGREVSRKMILCYKVHHCLRCVQVGLSH